jgi:hypothetical protein
MRSCATAFVVVSLTVAFAACGGNKEAEQAKAAEETKKAAEQAVQGSGGSVQDMAKGMEQFAQSMQQLQQSQDGKTYEPVSFKDLQAMLPDISGWEKEKPRGEMMTAPVKFSQAEVAYTKGEARVEVKIVDTTMSQMLTLPYQMFLMANYARETDSGYEKATKVGGYPGWEKWDSEDKRAETGAIVGQRFLVTVEGSGVENAAVVKDIVAKIDLGKLAGMK